MNYTGSVGKTGFQKDKKMKRIKAYHTQDVPKNFTGIVDLFWGPDSGISREEHFKIVYLENKKYHRIDGPAEIFVSTGKGYFWLNDKGYSKETWFKDLTEDEKIQALYNIDEWRNVD